MINLYDNKFLYCDERQYIVCESFINNKTGEIGYKNHKYFTKLSSIVRIVKDDLTKTALKKSDNLNDFLNSIKELDRKAETIKKKIEQYISQN